MKLLKRFGLAVLAAPIAMALLSASSAMAESTALCTVDQSPCETVNQVREVHEASVGKAVLLTSVGNVECSVLFSGTVRETGSPLVILGNFTYSNCTTGCSARELNGPSTIKVLKLGHEDAEVTGEGLVYVHCTEISCSYNGVSLKGTAKGKLLSTQTNGEVTLTGQETTKEAGGLICPKTAKLDITMTPLTATYIATTAKPEEFEGKEVKESKETALCSADEATCSATNQLGSVHETSVGKAVLLTSIGNAECNVLFSGTIATKLANPLVISGNFTYTNCELGSSKCTATEENGPSEIKILKEGHETAAVTGKGLFHVVCSGFIDCSYNGIGLSGTARGPLLAEQKNGEVFLLQVAEKEAGGFLCPKKSGLDIVTTTLTATYISN